MTLDLASYQGQQEIAEAIQNLAITPDPQRSLWFDNVATMRQGDLPVGVTSATRGYYAVNDGGSAFYYVREPEVGDVDDGKNIIILDNGNVAEKITSTEEILENMIDEIDLARVTFCSMLPIGNFYATQGMCVAGKYLIVTAFESDLSATRLYVIDIENKSVVGYTDKILGHAGSMCYDANNSHVCVADGTTIHRFTLSSAGALTYLDDVVTSPSVGSIAWHGGLFYMRSARVIVISENITTEIKRLTLTEGLDHLTLQGMDVDEYFIYIPSSGRDGVERIYMYDKINGELVKTLSFSRGTYGELEEIAVYGRYIFLNINRPFNDTMLGIYKVPLYKDSPVEYDFLRADMLYARNLSGGTSYYDDNHNIVLLPNNIYVDNTNSIAFPTGTSDYPLNSLAEAIEISLVRENNVTIVVSGVYNNTIHIRGCNKYLFFDFASATVNAGVYILNAIAYINELTAKQIKCEKSFVSLDKCVLNGQNDNTVASPIINYRGVVVGNVTISNYTTNRIDTGHCGITALTDKTIDMEKILVPQSSGSDVTMCIINGIALQNNKVSLDANDDLNKCLNTYLQYYTYNNSGVANSPTSHAYTMRVERYGGNAYIQILTDATTGDIYNRKISSGTPAAWNKITATAV